jgi:hypothetical protein
MALAALVSSLALMAAQPPILLAQADPQAAQDAAPADPASQDSAPPAAEATPPPADAAPPATDAAPPAENAGAPLSTGENPADAAQADAVAKGEAPFPAGAPTDDYGLVGWCYGALSGHMGLYKRAMPEVERIERAFPDPDVPIEEALKDYADQHEQGAKDLDMFKSALDAADKADPTAHAAARQASIELGLGTWQGADKADKRTLAQLWMSWALPVRCETTAQKLLTADAGAAQ